MLYTFYKYLKNNGLIATFFKICTYLNNNGLVNFFNRILQLNKYNKFDLSLEGCSPNSLNSLPMIAVVIYKNSISPENKEKLLSNFFNFDIIFVNFENCNVLFQEMQYSRIIILCDLEFEDLSNSIQIEINRLSLKVIKYALKNENLNSRNICFNKKKVLVVNCFYYPLSFGGATIVVEEINKKIHDSNLFEIYTFTITASNNKDLIGKVLRYEAFEQNVFSYYVDKLKHNSNFNNQPDLLNAFENILSNLKPNLVHFHSIQGMGEEMINICHKINIKTIVTCHDFWWLTEKQFLTTQNFLDNNVDNNVFQILKNEESTIVMNRKNALKKVNLILSPSVFLEKILLKLDFKNIKFNKNGIKIPTNNFSYRRVDKNSIVFGFIGGKSEIKGFNLIIEAFKKINSKKIKLIIVDNTTSLGYSSITINDLKGIPNYELIPSFKQDEIDLFYQRIDILLYPSLAIESFGLAPREAACRNKLIIATDIGGITEDISQNSNFYLPLSPKFDFEELCLKINQACILIEEGKKNDSKSFIYRDFSRQANELEDIYLAILNE
ncbi:glycosyltransferase [Acinetobacter parvus]|uniref:glycosyltransferase n=1 Tax=Acinetobacter parvus TaxID=134533 RepID=UPI0021D27480|nr:glycosyltransferase [Acinetobacter parvus]MCU4394083.1 glycosyltransferase [Acinetobacter parvus]